MGKPHDIPQGVWERAICYFVVDVQDHKAVARAILAARNEAIEEAALVCEDYEHLAQAIRALKPTP